MNEKLSKLNLSIKDRAFLLDTFGYDSSVFVASRELESNEVLTASDVKAIKNSIDLGSEPQISELILKLFKMSNLSFTDNSDRPGYQVIPTTVDFFH